MNFYRFVSGKKEKTLQVWDCLKQERGWGFELNYKHFEENQNTQILRSPSFCLQIANSSPTSQGLFSRRAERNCPFAQYFEINVIEFPTITYRRRCFTPSPDEKPRWEGWEGMKKHLRRGESVGETFLQLQLWLLLKQFFAFGFHS